MIIIRNKNYFFCANIPENRVQQNQRIKPSRNRVQCERQQMVGIATQLRRRGTIKNICV